MKSHKLISLLLVLLLLAGCAGNTVAPTPTPEVTPTVEPTPSPEPTPEPHITISDIMERYSAVTKKQIAENPERFLNDIATINYYPDVTAVGWEQSDYNNDLYEKEFSIAGASASFDFGENGKPLTCGCDFDMEFSSSETAKLMYDNTVKWATDKFGPPDQLERDSYALWDNKFWIMYSEELKYIYVIPYFIYYVADGVVTDY